MKELLQEQIDIPRLIDFGFKKGADEIEIFHLKDRSIKIHSEYGKITVAVESNDEGIGVRVLKNKLLGTSYTTNIEEKSLKKKIEKTIKITGLKNEKVDFIFPPSQRTPKIKGIYSKKLGDISASQAIGLMERVLTSINSNSKQNRKIEATYGLIETHNTSILISNSQGFNDSYKKTSIIGGIRTLLNRKGNTGNGFGVQFCSELDKFNPEGIAEESCKQAIESLNSSKVDTGKTDLIIDPHGNTKLFIPFTKTLFADKIQNQQSILIDKIGEEIGSNNLTIIDDGTIQGGLGSTPFDDEGIISKRKIILEDGIFKNILYDLETSANEGLDSTGNGLRTTFYPNHKKYKFPPAPGVTNFILKKGDQERDEMISDTKKGVLATFLVGDGDPASGDFSFEIRNGYKIENGEIKGSVEQASFSGNILRILENIQGIGNNPIISQAFIGVGQGTFITPSIKISDALVIGE
jgi:PmbA protein